MGLFGKKAETAELVPGQDGYEEEWERETDKEVVYFVGLRFIGNDKTKPILNLAPPIRAPPKRYCPRAEMISPKPGVPLCDGKGWDYTRGDRYPIPEFCEGTRWDGGKCGSQMVQDRDSALLWQGRNYVLRAKTEWQRNLGEGLGLPRLKDKADAYTEGVLGTDAVRHPFKGLTWAQALRLKLAEMRNDGSKVPAGKPGHKSAAGIDGLNQSGGVVFEHKTERVAINTGGAEI